MDINGIEWWMIDGVVGLIILVAAIIGAAKGIGDTLLRIVGFFGGIALAFMYSEKVADWLSTQKFAKSLHGHIYAILSAENDDIARAALPGGTDIVTPDGDTSFLGSISRSLGDIFADLADKTAEAMATRLTEVALRIFSFAIIILGTALVVLLIRLIIKSLVEKTVVLGFADRLLGFVLGALRGLLIAWVAVALLIPATTLFSPEKVPAMLVALQQTTVAKVLYDVNPLLMLVKYVFKA